MHTPRSRQMMVKAALAAMGSAANPMVFNWVGPDDPPQATIRDSRKRDSSKIPLESERRTWILPPPPEYRSPR
jgi:hypothetical protein